jgi:hypothetical protein
MAPAPQAKRAHFMALGYAILSEKIGWLEG